ncbi:MAG: sulfurtransferase TusA family protein [Synechococcus lacustris]
MTLNLRGTPCPLNFIRTKLALEKLQPGESLTVELDGGEPDLLVSEGLQGDSSGLVAGFERQLLADGAVRLRLTRG